MDELAAEAGISKRTLYRYFSSKDEIIETVLDRFMNEIANTFEEFSPQHYSGDDIFNHLLDSIYHIGRTIGNPLILEDLRQYYPHYWKRIDEFRMKKAQLIIKSILDSGKTNNKELDPRIVTTAVLASLQAVANPEFILSNRLTFEETTRQLIEFFKYGLLGERS